MYVCTGTLGDNITGHLYLAKNLIDTLYLAMLHDVINPMITQVVENPVDFPEDQFISEERSSSNRTIKPLITEKMSEITSIRIIQINR